MRDGVQHLDIHLRGKHTFSLEGAKLPNFYRPEMLAATLACIPQTEVYWFGSRVWGNAVEQSDFDLCVIVRSKIGPFLLLHHLVHAYSRGYNPSQSNIDLLVFAESTQVAMEQEIIQNARRGIRVTP